MKDFSEVWPGLQSLSCERLSSNDDNLRLVDDFFNRRNDGIAQTLRNEAFGEDEEGTTAYYVVKHSNGQILFFFSLKCGMLYDQFLDTRQLKLINDLTDYLGKIVSDDNLCEEDRLLVDMMREKLRTRKGISKAELERLPKKGSTIFEDLEKEFNESITRVGQTFSAVELVHFCANDQTEDLWASMNCPQSLGTVVFWHFIANIIMDVRSQIGCQYLFLFAADDSEDEHLIHYYTDQINFMVPTDLATAKPIYDFSCKFMCQEVKDLAKGQEDFFNHFLPDEA